MSRLRSTAECVDDFVLVRGGDVDPYWSLSHIDPETYRETEVAEIYDGKLEVHDSALYAEAQDSFPNLKE